MFNTIKYHLVLNKIKFYLKLSEFNKHHQQNPPLIIVLPQLGMGRHLWRSGLGG